MAFSEEELTAIEKAIASGSLRVKYQDKEVEYRSLAEMNAIRNQIKLSLASANTDPLRRVVGIYDSGL